MKILIIGSGAREEALCWKFLRSSFFKEKPDARIYIWPKTSSTFEHVYPFPCSKQADHEVLACEARDLGVELCVCGPEGPLDKGLKEAFAKYGVRVFGPSSAVAKLESSKSFAKDVMRAAQIPTASYTLVNSEESCRRIAYESLRARGSVVLKADGLAGGKGVFVCTSDHDLDNALDSLYGPGLQLASQQVLIEECLIGRECSYFSLHNPNSIHSLGFAVDFKRLGENDCGPNTGGMGCYSPVPWLPDDAQRQVEEKVIQPLLRVLSDRGLTYEGFLYVGLMWTSDGPKVIEFNVRLGDPEAQVLVVQDQRDWLGLMIEGCHVDEEDFAAPTQTVGVVISTPNYARVAEPFIRESAKISPKNIVPTDKVKVFAGAMTLCSSGDYSPISGRVLSVVGKSETFKEARTVAYGRCEEIAQDWPEAYWRSDIASRVALEDSGTK